MRRRRHVVALLMGAPAIVTAFGLTALQPWQLYRPAAPRVVERSAVSDASVRDEAERATVSRAAHRDALVTCVDLDLIAGPGHHSRRTCAMAVNVEFVMEYP